MKSKDFNNWVIGETDWKQVGFEYTTKTNYQNPQDLKAVFWNAYIYYQQKIDGYFKEHNELPIEFLKELIFKFRQSFPRENRVKGINYFDDLIEQLIEKYGNQKNNTPIENKRYWLKSFFNKEIQKSGEYKSLKRLIDASGFFTIVLGKERFKIYTPEMALILSNDKIDVEVLNRCEKPINKIINGRAFQKTYFESYRKGIEYFDTDFSVTTSTLYGEHAKKYVNDLHTNYFHNTNNDCLGMGWNYFKKYYPTTLTNDIVKKFGYYSGILSKVDELIDKHPELFKSFDLCQSEVPQPIIDTENRTKQKISEFIENMDSKGYEYAFRTEQEYNMFTDILTNFFEYKEYDLPKTTIQLKRGCKTKLGKCLGEIHKDLSENPLKSDNKYFEIVKILSVYQKETDLYKVLTR